MLAILGRAKGRSDEPRDLVRPVASILCTLVSDRCQHPQFGRGLEMYLDHIGTVDMFEAGYSVCYPWQQMAEVYSVISSRYKSGSRIGRTVPRPFSLRKTAVAEIRAEAGRRPGVSARSSVATVHGKRAVCGLHGPGCPRPASPSVREETFARGLTTRPGYKRSMYRYHWHERKNGLWAWDHCYGS